MVIFNDENQDFLETLIFVYFSINSKSRLLKPYDLEMPYYQR